MKIHSRSGCVWGKYGHLWGGPYYGTGDAPITCLVCQAVIAKRTRRGRGKRKGKK
jgi:hypothetical protein